jgi:hypothetical protein
VRRDVYGPFATSESITERAGKAVTLWTCFREALDSNYSQDTGYLRFSFVLQENILTYLDYATAVLSESFQFVNLQSSHLLLYNGQSKSSRVCLLRAHTLAPSILPLLEAPAEGFFWNLPEFGRPIPFHVLHGIESCPSNNGNERETVFPTRTAPKPYKQEKLVSIQLL